METVRIAPYRLKIILPPSIFICGKEQSVDKPGTGSGIVGIPEDADVPYEHFVRSHLPRIIWSATSSGAS